MTEETRKIPPMADPRVMQEIGFTTAETDACQKWFLGADRVYEAKAEAAMGRVVARYGFDAIDAIITAWEEKNVRT